MPIIKQLSQHEAQKIAAGEVIERPASIVKELVENSLDAGATRITIHIRGGGKQLIQVIDNGCGMDEEDAQFCFAKHATSKLSCVDDIEKLTTFGFRGEALASIAAISEVTLITRTNQHDSGTKIFTHHAHINNVTSVSCPVGTDIRIESLFDSVPARKKFLKADQTEWHHIAQLVHALSLGNPHIHFVLTHNDTPVLNCPSTPSLQERCTQVWDYKTSNHLHAITAKRETPMISIEGMAADHQIWRYDRNTIFLFVNGRWVKNQKLVSAVIKGYGSILPAGRFPVACMFVQVNADTIDINIHPRKEEVLFKHPKIVEQLLETAISHMLNKNVTDHLIQPVFPTSPNHRTEPLPDEPDYFDLQHTTLTAYQNKKITREPTTSTSSMQSWIPPSTTALTSKNNAVLLPEERPTIQQKITPAAFTYTLIGNLNKTYLLIETQQGLTLIDQHAAHERILYERFATRFEDVVTIALLFACTVTLSPADIALIIPHLSLLHAHGIIAEPFGQECIVIQSVPVHLKHANLTELIYSFVGIITQHNNLSIDEFNLKTSHALRAQMACKAAIKAGDELSDIQMHEIIEQLHAGENRSTCPHGRPTMWQLTIPEIERFFKRRT